MCLVLKEQVGLLRKKLTEVTDTYENSQMYLPGKYSKLSGTGSAKPGGCLFLSQNVGNSQNSAA